MEEIKLEVKTTETSERVIYTGYHQLTEVKQFYDLHGTKIDEGTKIVQTPNAYAYFTITAKNITYHWECMPATTSEIWTLYMNGKKVEDLGEIVGYQALKRKLKLTSCVGQG